MRRSIGFWSSQNKNQTLSAQLLSHDAACPSRLRHLQPPKGSAKSSNKTNRLVSVALTDTSTVDGTRGVTSRTGLNRVHPNVGAIKKGNAIAGATVKHQLLTWNNW